MSQIRYFSACGVPEGYSAQYINGFVEELVVNDDPEYQWIDKIRTPRASNEARQTLFLNLSGAVQRKIGLKAIELGGNAVIGYEALREPFCNVLSRNIVHMLHCSPLDISKSLTWKVTLALLSVVLALQ